MKLQFLGATGTVTGSKFLLHDKHHSWMVDCGLFQGLKELRERNWKPLPFDISALNAVILTHAHIDHSGYLPALVRDGFAGPAYASEPTVELCKILLPDSGYLQEEDAKYAAKQGFSKHKPPKPLYTYEDAVVALNSLHHMSDHERHVLIGGIKLTFLRAGHILGARLVALEFTKTLRQKKIIFTGDIGGYNSLMAADPELIGDDVDYLVMESTYGNRLHDKEDVLERFEKMINDAVSKDGKILIPAFAVGKTQDILYILHLLEKQGRLANVPIFLNSPMAIDATEIYGRFIHEHKFFEEGNVTPDVFHPNRLKIVQSSDESKRLNSLDGPAIIISSAGMMTGGRILHHLKAYLPDPNSTLVITGFQAEGTRGRLILEGAKAVKIHGMPIAVRCNIEVVESLSAHGDWKDLMIWLGNFKRPPKHMFLVHGEESAAKAMQERIVSKLGWSVSIPKYGDEAEL